jgi:tRNA pseudouridine65 synthase
MQLEIIYKDQYLVAINKPPGLLVHRTSIASNAIEFAVQMLRDQLLQHVYPIHRLDRKTSGCLLFALDDSTLRLMQRAFADREVLKTYLAMVRGHTEDQGTIDYPLKKENGHMQDAITHYRSLEKLEIQLPFGKHATSRYTLLEISPQTGRKHQIRRHMAHIRHPIIADRPHGDNKQNKLFKEKFGLMTMMLHASKLEFMHPVLGSKMAIQAELPGEFKRMLRMLKKNTIPPDLIP